MAAGVGGGGGGGTRGRREAREVGCVTGASKQHAHHTQYTPHASAEALLRPWIAGIRDQRLAARGRVDAAAADASEGLSALLHTVAGTGGASSGGSGGNSSIDGPIPDPAAVPLAVQRAPADLVFDLEAGVARLRGLLGSAPPPADADIGDDSVEGTAKQDGRLHPAGAGAGSIMQAVHDKEAALRSEEEHMRWLERLAAALGSLEEVHTHRQRCDALLSASAEDSHLVLPAAEAYQAYARAVAAFRALVLQDEGGAVAPAPAPASSPFLGSLEDARQALLVRLENRLDALWTGSVSFLGAPSPGFCVVADAPVPVAHIVEALEAVGHFARKRALLTARLGGLARDLAREECRLEVDGDTLRAPAAAAPGSAAQPTTGGQREGDTAATAALRIGAVLDGIADFAAFVVERVLGPGSPAARTWWVDIHAGVSAGIEERIGRELPADSADLPRFVEELLPLLEHLDRRLLALGLGPPLVGVLQNIRSRFIRRKREQILASARALLAQTDFRKLSKASAPARRGRGRGRGAGGGGGGDSSPGPFSVDFSFFPECAVTGAARDLLRRVELTLLEAAALDADADEWRTVLVRTAADLPALYESCVPVFFAAELTSVPSLAAVFHNDCMFLAHNLLTLGPRTGIRGDQAVPLFLSALALRRAAPRFLSAHITAFAQPHDDLDSAGVAARAAHRLKQVSVQLGPEVLPRPLAQRILGALEECAGQRGHLNHIATD